MKVLFLDTNVFLQCRPLAELPWNDFIKGDDLLLLIPRAVQEELDRLKQDGNSRRAKRARKASAFLRELVLSTDSMITLQEHDPKVQVMFSPPIDAGRAPSQLLDLSRPDDRIISELLAYVAEHPAADAALMTHDTYPMITAKRLNLAFVSIPEEWLLQAEPDERDKKLSELERRLSIYERSAPVITFSVSDQNGGAITRLQLSISVYPDLTSEEIENLIVKLRQRHPIATDFGEKAPSRQSIALAGNAMNDKLEGYEWKYQALTKEDIAKYTETEYPAWEEKARAIFQQLATRLELPSRRADIIFALENKGSVPAENVIVEFEALGGILFEPAVRAGEDKKPTLEISFPKAPGPPHGMWIRKRVTPFFDALDTTATLLRASQDFLHRDLVIPRLLDIPAPRDRNLFYWKHGRPSNYADKWIFECAEFRHQVHCESFKLPIFISKQDNIHKGAVVCTVTAKNLPEPARFTLPVLIDQVQCDTEEAASALIQAS